MITIITESGSEYTGPDSLEELSKDDLIRVLQVQPNLQHAVIHQLKDQEQQQRLILLNILYGINYWAWVDFSPADQQKLLLSTKWVNDCRVQTLPFSSFELNSTIYYLPKPGFGDSCAVEVALGNIWYLSFANPQRPNPEALFHLLATVYRPAAVQEPKKKRFFQTSEKLPDIDPVRKEFDSAEAEGRAHLFKQLPFGLGVALLQYWEKMNADFLKRYPDLFEKSGDEENESMYQGGEGWIACLEEVGEVGTYGSTEKVFMENVHTIFGYMRRKQIKVRKIENDAED